MIKLKLNPKKLEESLRKSDEKKKASDDTDPLKSIADTNIIGSNLKSETLNPAPEISKSGMKKDATKKRKRVSDQNQIHPLRDSDSSVLPKISFRNPALPKIKVKAVSRTKKTDDAATSPGISQDAPSTPKKPKIKLSSSLLNSKVKHSSPKKANLEQEILPTGKKEKQLPKVSLSLKSKKEALPRIRVKASRQPGQGYDSEAPDREDDPMIEEAIVLRMVPGAHLDYLRATCDAGDLSRVNIKFKDARRAVVSINEQLFAAKLVDLPTITEAHKTFDRKNIYKVSDICQMLLVTEPIAVEDDIFHLDSTGVDRSEATVISHGITPPLHNVKHRRFRKRISRKVIETMEAKVEELFRLDDEAEESHYELLDPGALNSAQPPSSRASSVAPRGSTPQPKKDHSVNISAGSVKPEIPDDAPTPYNMLSSRGVSPAPDTEQEEEEEEEDGDEEDLLGLELERALEGQVGDESNEDDEDDDDDDDDEEEEDDDDNEPRSGQNKGLDEEMLEAISYNKIIREEIQDLEASIRKKKENAANTSNALLRDRFIKVVKKLEQELEVKKRQLRNVKEQGDNIEESASGAFKGSMGSGMFPSPEDDGVTPLPQTEVQEHISDEDDEEAGSDDARINNLDQSLVEHNEDISSEDEDEKEGDDDIESLF